MSKVFYVPGQTSIIDYAREIAPGKWATRCRLLMLPELQISHPGAVLGDEEAFLLDQEATHGTRPTETTAARYDYAFSHLAVSDFAADEQCDSFKLECCEVGNVTRIFAHWDGRYWTFLGLANLPHQVIVERLSQSRTGATTI
jgi:PmbA protein